MKKMRFSATSLLLAVLIWCHPGLSAEIEAITIKWIAQECTDACIQNLAQRFLSIPGTAELLMNGGQGQAVIRWKPYAPFSFDSINSAMRLAGPRIKDIRFKVRGTVIGSGGNYVLRSLGDNTQFVLLGPVQPSTTQYVQQYSMESHPLSAESLQRFYDAQRNNVVVTIEGPLYEPTRLLGSSLYLIVESAAFARLGAGAIPGSP